MLSVGSSWNQPTEGLRITVGPKSRSNYASNSEMFALPALTVSLPSISSLLFSLVWKQLWADKPTSNRCAQKFPGIGIGMSHHCVAEYPLSFGWLISSKQLCALSCLLLVWLIVLSMRFRTNLWLPWPLASLGMTRALFLRRGRLQKMGILGRFGVC